MRPCCARVLRCPLFRPGACCARSRAWRCPPACTDAVVSLSRPSRRPPVPRVAGGRFPLFGRRGGVQAASLDHSRSPPACCRSPAAAAAAACRLPLFEACWSRPTAAHPFSPPQPQPWRRTCVSAPNWTASCGPPRRAAPSLTRKCGGCGPRCVTRARQRCWTTCGCRR